MTTLNNSATGLVHLLDSARGVYLPRDAEEILQRAWFAFIGSGGAWILDALRAGPDAEDYWEAWTRVLDTAAYTDERGRVWCLYQDGDLFAVCDELLTDDGRAALGWED